MPIPPPAPARFSMTTGGPVSPGAMGCVPSGWPPPAAALGALPIVELLARGQALPRNGAPVALGAVKLAAPLPRPRRNIFCIGKNYHAHAKEFAGSGFDS